MNLKPRVALVSVLVVVALGAGAHFGYREFESRRAMERAKAAAKAAAEKNAKAAALARVQAVMDPGPSQWLQRGLAPLWNALAKSKSAVLVVPPGNPEDRAGLDIPARVAFARALVDSLSAEVAALVPDPGFALAAIGEPRAIDDAKLLERLSRSPFESLVTGTFAMEPGRVSLELRRTNVRTGARKTFQAKVDLVANVLPEQALASVASQAMRALEFESSPRELPVPAAAASTLAFPASPLAATTDAVDPQTGIWLQQLFGILHSPNFLADPRARERSFEQSLWSLSGAGVDAADRAVLEARALAYLGRRDAALRVLSAAPAGPEQAALRAFLNADLPELKKTVGGIRRPVARLIAELELLAVRGEARDLPQEARRAELQRILQAVPEPWQVLVSLYGLSSDPWDYPPAFAVKSVLERDFPVPDYQAQEILRARAAMGANLQDTKLEAELMLSPLVHARRWREQHLEAICCAAPAARGHRPSAADYLGLLENHADALMLARLYFLREVQGNAEQALAMIKLYDEILFAGSHPGVLMQRGAGFVPGAGLQLDPRRHEEVFEASRRIRAWIGHQSKAASWAARHWMNSVNWAASTRGFQRTQDEVLRSMSGLPLSGDVPGRDVFLVDLASALIYALPNRQAEKAALRGACAAALDFFHPCEAYVAAVHAHGQAEERTQAEALIRDRFVGYADATEQKVTLLLEQGKSAESKVLLRDAIRTSPSPDLRARLAGLLTDEGAFDEAASVYASLPGLKGGGNTVEHSNYLRRAARSLLARGAVAQARPLMETAASHADGSHANLEAGVYAAHWRGDGELALQRLGVLYQRYQNERTLGEIASMTFALGDQRAGWSVLESATASSPDFAFFAAATVGMRREGAGAQRLLAWANAGRTGTYSWYAAAAFRVLAVDRAADSLERAVEAERPIRLKYPGNYSHGAVAGAQHAMTADDNALAWRATVEGYRGLLRGEFAAAADAFSQLLARFDATGLPQGLEGPENFWATIPYAAYALAKSGSREQAATMLERFDEARQRAAGRNRVVVKRVPAFESHLVAAVLSALAGNHADGLRLLRLARANVPLEDRARLIPEAYQYAELAEWLSRDTGNPAYAAAALEFARGRQAFEPWAAWSYAFEATHSRDQAARVRAAATAMWLDPESRRLQALPVALKSAAKQSLQANPPFRKPAAGRREAKA